VQGVLTSDKESSHRSSQPTGFARAGQDLGQGAAEAGQPQVSLALCPLFRHAPHALHINSIVIALAGNKVDLVRPSSDSDEPTTPTSATSDDDEADDATATPEDDGAEGADEEGTVAASESRRQVSREEAEEYAKECGLLFFETSAKTGEGVVEVFTEIGECLAIVSGYWTNAELSLQPRRSPWIISSPRLADPEERPVVVQDAEESLPGERAST
jgi:hypothetical protein